jgi:Cysteine-rich secretory protein family
MTYRRFVLAVALIAPALFASEATAQCPTAGCQPLQPAGFTYTTMPAPVEMLPVPDGSPSSIRLEQNRRGLPPVSGVQAHKSLEPKAWHDLSNLPGVQGYGVVLPSGFVDPERFRRKSDHSPITGPTRPSPEWLAVSGAAPRVYASPSAPIPAAQPSGQVAATDPYGFGSWLNSTRAAYGLSAVGYDANLSNWAAMNNDCQASSGLGHYVMGPARRQNSGQGSLAAVESMWMTSPAHRAGLLDPTLRWYGIAGLGAYWTFNGN